MFTIKMSANKRIDVNKIIENVIATCYEGQNTFKKIIKVNEYVSGVYVCEKYYFRIQSTLAVTVITSEKKDSTNVDIVAAGGYADNDYTIMPRSAEKSAAFEFSEVLSTYGFVRLQK